MTVFLLGLLVSLPSILSTPTLSGALLSHLNQRLPGTLHLDNLDLAWREQQGAQGITYTDEEGREVAVVQDITLSKGLLAMVTGYPDLGELKVDGLHVTAPLPPPKPEKEPPASKPGRGTPKPRPEKALATFAPPSVTVQLLLENATISVKEHDGDVREMLNHLTADVALNRGSPGGVFSVSGDSTRGH